jgi:hypothetical protein
MYAIKKQKKKWNVIIEKLRKTIYVDVSYIVISWKVKKITKSFINTHDNNKKKKKTINLVFSCL